MSTCSFVLIPCVQLYCADEKARSVRPMVMNITLSLQFAVGQGSVINLHGHTGVVWWRSALLNASHLVPKQASKNLT